MNSSCRNPRRLSELPNKIYSTATQALFCQAFQTPDFDLFPRDTIGTMSRLLALLFWYYQHLCGAEFPQIHPRLTRRTWSWSWRLPFCSRSKQNSNFARCRDRVQILHVSLWLFSARVCTVLRKRIDALRMRKRPRENMASIIARQINTVVYGGSGLVFNMGIIA